MRGPFLFRAPAIGILLVALFAFFPAPAQAKAKKAKTLDLTDTVLTNRILTKFAILLRTSQLGSFLSSRGPFTLFAPTDSAFSKLPPGAMDALLRPENLEALQRIVLFHMVNGQSLDVKNLATKKSLLSCEGNPLSLRLSHSGAQFVVKSKILRADIHCANGLMHQIDTVLIPPGISLAALAAAPPAPPAPPSTDTSTNAAPAGALTPSAADSNATNPVVPPVAPADVPIAPVAPAAQ
jgi:uncharacterized surface protein with fasciclin (FAS1) repeats